MFPQTVYYSRPMDSVQYQNKHYPHVQLHPHQVLNQQQQPSQPPLTPLDLTYSQSMLPSNLLMGSPYFASPASMHFPPQAQQHAVYQMVPPSPVMASPRQNHRTFSHSSHHSNSHNHNHHSQHGSPYLTHLNNTTSSNSSNSLLNHNLDQLNLSRTVILKNLDPNLTLNDLLNEVEYGPIEYCKMFTKATSKSILARDPSYPKEVKVCYISFINSKISILFHLRYLKNASQMSALKAKLNDSKHLRIQLNDTASVSPIGSATNTLVPTTNNQDFIKLKTLNYILEFNATRCLLIKFTIKIKPEIADVPENSRIEHIKLFINNQCLKFGDVEDFIIDLNTQIEQNSQSDKKSEVTVDSDDSALAAPPLRTSETEEAAKEEEDPDSKELKESEEQIEDEKDSTNQATPSESDVRFPGSVIVHFTSIDAAIKTYESYLRRIQHDIQRLINNKEGTTKKRTSRDVNEVNLRYDIKFSNVSFHQDRCDRTPVEPASNLQKKKSKPSVGGAGVTKSHIQQFTNIPEEDVDPLDTASDILAGSGSASKSDCTAPAHQNLMDSLSPTSSLVDDPSLSISSGESPIPMSKQPVVGHRDEVDVADDDDSLDHDVLNSSNYSTSVMSQNSGYSPYPRYQALQTYFPAMMPIMPTTSHPGMSNPVGPSSGSATGSNYQMNPDPFNVGNRTIYLGNLHPNTTIEEIANNVRAGGLVESINYHQEKKVCFITFVDPGIALKFYLNHQVLHQLIIHGYDITVGWAKQHSGPVSREVSLAVTAGASRNVYIGIKLIREPNPDGSTPVKPRLPAEDELREDFSKFGELEQINFYHNKDCGFLNFLHIIDAIKLVEIFENDAKIAISKLRKLLRHEKTEDVDIFYNKYKPFKISFAKDRCGNQPKFSFKKKMSGTGSTYKQYQQNRNKSIPKNKKDKFGDEVYDDEDYDEETRMNETDAFMAETISEEAAMVFGIISNSEKQENEEEKAEVAEDLEKNGDSAEAEIFPAVEESKDGKNPAVDNILGISEATEPEDNGDEELDEDEEDEDDVSIIIGSDETTSTTAHNSNKEYKKRSNSANGNHQQSNGRFQQRVYHNRYNNSDLSIHMKKSSRNSSNVSLNSNYGKYSHPPSVQHHQGFKFASSPYMQQQVYYYPQSGRNGSVSAVRPAPVYAPSYNGNFYPGQAIPAPPQQFYQPAPQQRYNPASSVAPPVHKGGMYSTSGSQVMAQYLAKSQHDNLIYAANILANEVDVDEDSEYDQYVYSSRHASVSSNKSKR
ncbi:predicted protein [Scheffersomyces stipitis CBS 6054]|uniref:RRM domain-containing protein n=1 Tax=Scheffersomyces stipitis (strain ATCC 58785 / CBS 6054 / NBRC 10063 / NRRL Y-11545) TaxID=322104 RepID=A3LW10_PICST|nr:predicted protein [Scheffersomyces stipitis CBS 6054]ABN67207.2 predicted protein [Scheffersomyces stipitis CBS 6054]